MYATAEDRAREPFELLYDLWDFFKDAGSNAPSLESPMTCTINANDWCTTPLYPKKRRVCCPNSNDEAESILRLTGS